MEQNRRTTDPRGKRPTMNERSERWDKAVIKVEKGYRGCLQMTTLGGSLLKLTQREMEVLRLFASGKSSKEVAEALSLSTHTVNNHRKNMKAGTASRNIAELVKMIQGKGLL